MCQPNRQGESPAAPEENILSRGPEPRRAEANGQVDEARLRAVDADGVALAGSPIAAAVRCLLAGGIVALEGAAGFQLLVDAGDEQAVTELRRRKGREAAPLALLVPNLAAARRLVDFGDTEAAQLESRERPILLLSRRRAVDTSAAADAGAPSAADAGASPAAASGTPIVAQVAPGRRRLGILLPATSLHDALLASFVAQSDRFALVVTSGNRAGEPIAIDAAAARAALTGVADLYLEQDRPASRVADDSVLRVDPGGLTFFRRARGHAPTSVRLAPATAATPAILACGADRACAPCLTRDGSALLSPHLGDLDETGTAESWMQAVRDLRTALDIEPAWIAVELDPRARSGGLGRVLGRELGRPIVEVQHHHAHVAACLVEHGQTEPVIGLVLDDGRLGTDGGTWGGEVLIADRARASRAGHLEEVPLAGDANTPREPWRLALSHLYAAYGDSFRRLPLALFERIEWLQVEEVIDTLRRGDSLPVTSSAVQLFEAVAAILGLRFSNRFDGDAVTALTSVMGELGGPGDETYGVRIEPRGEELVLRTEPLVRGVVVDLIRGLGPEVISLRFHRSLAALLAAACECVWKRAGIDTVALCGDLVRNAYLRIELTRRLKRLGFSVLRPHLLPPGDGGLAIGQAAVVAARLGGQDDPLPGLFTPGAGSA